MMSIGRRRIVFEPHLAGLLDVEGALGLAAVGPDLDEIADHGLHARQIKADAVEGGALLGVEGGGRLGAGLPLSMNENGKKPGRDGAASLAGGGPGLAAGGGGAGCAGFGLRRGRRQRHVLGGCRRP